MNERNRINIFTPLILLMLFTFSSALAGYFYFSKEKAFSEESSNMAVFAESSQAIIKPKSVCLDAGHGGDDTGAINDDLTEAEINLIVTQKVKSTLEGNGYQVYLTRSDANTTLSNNDRYTFCNEKQTDILVSIHHNDYADDSSVDYDTALFYKDSDQALANDILSSTSAALNLPNNGLVSFEDGVLSKSTMPAALSEAFFLSNYSEYSYLTEGTTRLNDEANGITQGIINYFNAKSEEK